MIREDLKKFDGLCETIAEMTKHKTDDAERWVAQKYLLFELFAKYSLEQVADAMHRHISASKFFPAPSEIIEQIEGTREERDMAAWRFALKWIDRVGPDYSVRFPEPKYHFAVENLGGWEKYAGFIRSLDEKERMYQRKEFVVMLGIGEKRASWDSEPGKVRVSPYLIGRNEREEGLPGSYFGGLGSFVVELGTGKKLPRDAFALGSGESLPSLPEYGGN